MPMDGSCVVKCRAGFALTQQTRLCQFLLQPPYHTSLGGVSSIYHVEQPHSVEQGRTEREAK